MILSTTFVIPDSHFGLYFAILECFYEQNGNKMTSFCKGTFQGSSLAGQMYHQKSQSLVQNCPMDREIYTIV